MKKRISKLRLTLIVMFVLGLLISFGVFGKLQAVFKLSAERYIQLECDRVATFFSLYLKEKKEGENKCFASKEFFDRCFGHIFVNENRRLYDYRIVINRETEFSSNLHPAVSWKEWGGTKVFQVKEQQFEVSLKPTPAQIKVLTSDIPTLILLLGIFLVIALCFSYYIYQILVRKNAFLSKAKGKLKDYNEQLSQKNEELEQYMYAASHDLQEPLNTINSLIEIIREDHPHLVQSGTINQNFLYIESAANSMNKLIQGLLKYSHLGKNRVLEQVSIHQVLDETIRDLGHRIKQSNATIHHPEKLPTLKGYSLELKLLFQNLLSNAIKYQQKGKKPIINILVDKIEDGWYFIVQDNGIGIEEKYQKQIFQLFQRLHNKKAYHGYGIGLAHCQKIIELHQGKIWVESEINQGSSFHFLLPNK